MQIAAIVVGALLLLMGRQLFWLFVGAAGFMAGVTLAGSLFPDNSVAVLVAGLVLGLVSALLAVTVQRVAVLAAGFFAGGYLFTQLTAIFLASPNTTNWLVFVIGGILGAVLLTLLFDWALVILSSLTGAVLIGQAIAQESAITLLIIAGLTVAGIFIQTSGRRR